MKAPYIEDDERVGDFDVAILACHDSGTPTPGTLRARAFAVFAL